MGTCVRSIECILKLNAGTTNLSESVFHQVALLSQTPRDASCLSVISFNSTKRRAESFIVSYVGYRFITACN